MLNFRRLPAAASRRGATALAARTANLDNNFARHISSLASSSPLGHQNASRNTLVPPFTNRQKSTGVTVGLSSLSEPGLNLFPTVPLGEDKPQEKLNSQTVPPDIKDAQLRADIRAMGHMLGQVIKEYEGQGKTQT